jgi:hypothetical protein
MGFVEILVGAIGIHSSQHRYAVLMSGPDDLAVQVPITQMLRSVVQRILLG